MLPVAQLPAALAALPAVEYRKVLYRVIRPRFLPPAVPAPGTPLTGIGAKLTGARFTPKGSFDTIYLAEDPLTAFVEFHNEHFRLMRRKDDEHAVRLPIVATLAPHATFTVGGILDLTRREVRAKLGTSLEELAKPWRTAVSPATQALGEEAERTGRFVGIRFFSVRNPGGVCLAIFENRLRAKGGTDLLDLDDSAHTGAKQTIP